jgi:signal peptidase II
VPGSAAVVAPPATGLPEEERGSTVGGGRRLGGTGRAYALLGAAAALVAGLDQLTKHLALRALEDGPVEVIPGLVTLRLTLNPGGAFGLGRRWPGLFLVATIVIIVVILNWVRRLDDVRWAVPLGLIVGGGCGNLIDRVFRPYDGRVVDFVDLHVWPVFNLADSSIVVGVAVIALLSLRTARERPAPEG